MIISVASGKGGTGKTTIATSLAMALVGRVRFLDCDVEEPNSHIFLKPRIKHTKNISIPVPDIDKSKCDFCGKCAEICEYKAIAVLRTGSTEQNKQKGQVLTFTHLCHGCGGCALLCPNNAIKETNKMIGVIESGYASIMPNTLEVTQGRLNINEIMAPPLIKAVKGYGKETRVVIDAPPGTSCPMVSAVKGTDFCLLVTEPTLFGLNDLMLAVEVLRKIKVPFGVVINRSDSGDKQINNYCIKENIKVLMRIPFKREIAIAYSEGRALINAFPEFKKDFSVLYEKIKEMIL